MIRAAAATSVLVGAAAMGCSAEAVRLGELPPLQCESGDGIAAAGHCFETSARELASEFEPLQFVTGDFDGDAYPDVVVTGATPTVVSALWRGTARGPTGPPTDPMLTGCSAFPVVGQIVGDASDDVLFPECESLVSVYPSSPDGFGPGQQIAIPFALRASALVDHEGDGDGDLVMLGEDADGLAALSVILTGLDGLEPPTLQPLTPLSFDPITADPGDFDGDGLIDLVLRHPDAAGALGFVRASQPGAFEPAVRLETELRPRTAAIADLDGDGDDDVVYGDDAAGVLCTWILDGVLDQVPVCRTREDVHPFHLAAADLDGDGLAEVVIADVEAATLWVWEVDLAADADVMEPLPVPAAPERIALVDFDDDGNLDVIAGHFAAKSFSIRLAVP